mgnify:CR=1 FL=1
MLRSSSKLLSRGFTLVELVVSITIASLLFIILFIPLDSFYESNRQSLNNIVQTGEVRSTLRALESEIALAISFHNTNTGIVTDPSGSNGNPSSPTQWTWTGYGGERVLITSNYATTEFASTDNDGSRTLVYGPDCETGIVNATVYFVKGGSLYRRTLANTGASTCSGYSMAQRTTCEVGVTASPCNSAPRDAKLLDNVSDFSVNYYEHPNSTSTYPSQYSNTSAPSSSQTVVISITAGAGTAQETGTIRITRLNGST